MPTRLSITPPGDYRLARDVCSYGYFLLAPNDWDPADRRFTRTLDLEGGPTTVSIMQPDGRGAPVRAAFDRDLTPSDRARARAQLTRMLRLDETSAHARAFHAVDPRWKRSGRSRLFRSPTLFEDIVKTVTSCNVGWTSTIKMNERLCIVCGRRSPSGHFAFPTPQRLARTRAGTLRARCSVGYRDARLIELARMFARGDIDEAWLTDPATPDDAAFEFLVSLPGIGPYAAGNIMQLLGRYSRLAIDTETFRHARAVLGYEGSPSRLTKLLHAHYDPFGEHKFRSYWFELWAFYESKRGPAQTWDRESTGRTFTAALLAD